mgnify:CR=1 FL=1
MPLRVVASRKRSARALRVARVSHLLAVAALIAITTIVSPARSRTTRSSGTSASPSRTIAARTIPAAAISWISRPRFRPVARFSPSASSVPAR